MNPLFFAHGIQRRGLLALVILCALPISARRASAVCMAPETPCREYEHTPIIFQGLVESVTVVEHEDPLFGQTGGRLWRVRVERAWKGLKDHEDAQLFTRGVPGKMWVEHEVDFKVGERYIIWARRSDVPPVLTTSDCSLTRPLQDAKDQVGFLESLTRPPAGGYVYGRVWRSDDLLTSDRIPAATGVTVVLEGNGDRRETRTDDDGRFRFVGLREGAYEVHLILPDTLAPRLSSAADPRIPRTAEPLRASLSINGPRDCASADFWVQSSALMSGFVARDDGTPLSGVTVQGARLNDLLQQDDNRAKGKFAFLYSAKAISDDRGYFEFRNLPPGPYVVGVTLEHDPNADQPYARTFHPGVPDISKATVFDLGAGEHLDVGAFTLPTRLVAITVRGNVVGEDGNPVADAFVAVTNNFGARLTASRTDKNGAFSLSLFAGYSYVLTASLRTGENALGGRVTCTPDTSGVTPIMVRIELRPRDNDSRR